MPAMAPTMAMSIVDPGASSITVAVRVRPFTIREAAQLRPDEEGKLFLGDGSLAAAPAPKLNQRGLRSVIKVVDDRCLVFDPPEDSPVQRFSRSVVPKSGKKVKDQVFAFDRVFDENTTQAEVYEGTTKDLLDSVLDGYNATVFAYGATGCGKTHTITGTAQHPGIIFMTMQELFEKIQDRSQEKSTEVSLSYLEIYNETIRDLLVPGGGNRQGLTLREDSQQSVMVAGLTSHHPRDVQQVMDMIVQGNEYRTVSPTAANATSSRSHAVLQINVAQKDRNADVNEPHTMATLSIIDLAGSERASATLNRGERLLEGANINKSLLALGSCINALCDPQKRNHVPYRNSKLTRLLKFSLGGNCKTVMIVCVSPSSAHFDETQNTLRYANRAKNIQTKVTRNVFNVNRHVKDFLVKIDEQMALINELKAQQQDAEGIFMKKFRKQLERREATAREGVQRLRAAYDNAAAERQDKLDAMKRLRAIERRIMLLTAWIAAFDAVCDGRGGGGGDGDGAAAAMPTGLATMRRTAESILVELENSRHHAHQKLSRPGWERMLDSTLQLAVKQLAADGNGVDDSDGQVAALAREADLLKATFMRDAQREVLDQDKAGDAEATRALLTAQFEMLASLSETLAMDEDDARSHTRSIVSKLLQTGLDAASQVIKADGSGPLLKLADLPPPKRGTPRRRSNMAPIYKATTTIMTTENNVRPLMISQPTFAVSHANLPAIVPPSVTSMNDDSICSPVKSPRRRKAHPRKGGFAFTPVKRKPAVGAAAKRAVRWRDDDGEEGTLADFEKTPQQLQPDSTPARPRMPSPAPAGSPSKQLRSPSGSSLPVLSSSSSSLSPSPSRGAPLPAPPAPSYLEPGNDSTLSLDHHSSPHLRATDDTTSSIPAVKPNRFQAGFLSKSRLSSAPRQGSSPKLSPETRLPSLSLNLASSDAEGRASPQPLRTLSPGKSSNLSPPSYGLKRSFVPRRSLSSQLDENSLPPAPSLASASSASSTSSAASTSSAPPPAPPAPAPSASASSAGLAAPRHRIAGVSPTRGISASHSDSDSAADRSIIDPLKVRSALRAAKKQRRVSLASGPAPNSSFLAPRPSRRLSSFPVIQERPSIGPGALFGGAGSSGHVHGHPHNFHSATSGIRRKSLERRKSPPMPCSPPEPSAGRAFTAGQARRFNFGGNFGNLSAVAGSPREGSSVLGMAGATGVTGFVPGESGRRTTIGPAGSVLRAKPHGLALR